MTPSRRVVQRLAVSQGRAEVMPDQYGMRYALPPIPPRKRSYGAYIWFCVCVVLPTLIGSVYYFLIASNQYVAEFRFTVQDTSATASATQSMNALLSVVSAGSSTNENYVVTDFLGSRDAIDQLRKRIDLVKLYSKRTVDWWSRFNASRPIEDFVSYWQNMLTARYDQVTGLASVQISAFSPQDALLIASTMASISEDLVNRVVNRANIEAVKYAENEVKKAEDRLKGVRAQMTAFRNRTGVIDPTTSVVASNSALTQSLRSSLSQLETQLATLQRQNVNANSPIVISLQNQIKSTKDQIKAVEATVANSRDGAPLSKVTGEYEQLQLEQQFAQNMVTSTMSLLEQARANAAARHLFITPYVQPSLPESASFPRPFRSVGGIALLAFIFWVCSTLVFRSIRERFA